MDPIDGSSNIDPNISVGTIFTVLPARANGIDASSFLQPGDAQLAAGFAVYGPYTSLVLTVGAGTHIFTLQRTTGQFILTAPEIDIPAATREYSINASNYRHWDDSIRTYMDDCLRGFEGPRGKNFNMRWTASPVADIYRLLTRGGIFLYPGDMRENYTLGRLRLVYEANPLAWIIEQAGPDRAAYLGRAVVGRGLAAGDLDGDGRVDLIVVHRGAPAAVLRNATGGESGHRLRVRLRGPAGRGTPIGASVTVEAGGRRQSRWLTSGTGYLSGHEGVLHFGLGAADRIDGLEVRWADGTQRSWRGSDAPAPDRGLEIRQGAGHDAVAQHLAGIPEVLEAYTITGAGDMWARVVARSNADLQRVIDLVLTEPGIDRSTTVIALATQIPYRVVPLARTSVTPPPA